MKVARTVSIVLCVLLGWSALTVQAGPPPAFTYQGQLKQQGTPVNGGATFTFTLWNAVTGGNQIGVVVVEEILVANGLFTASLDFGDGAFNGEPRWLEIKVAKGSDVETLSPRQPVTPAPFALYAINTPAPSPWSSMGNHIYYNIGNVGIGVVNPSEKLDVAGTVKMTGIKLPTSAVNGYVLTSDATGIGTWRPGGAGGSPWLTSGTDVYYTAGKVGVGTSTPSYPFQVVSGGMWTAYAESTTTTGVARAVYGFARSTSGYGVVGTVSAGSGTTYGVAGESWSPDGYAVHGRNEAEGGNAHGVYGESWAPAGIGVHGYVDNSAGNGSAKGVYGEVLSTAGTGVYGNASATSGLTYGVRGTSVSPNGFAGYFNGRGYFSGNVGIGTTAPEYPLHVVSANSGPVVYVEASGASSGAVYGFAQGSMTGVRGESSASGASGTGVSGKAWSATGTTVGVVGASLSPAGIGVKGENSGGGWAGYFLGKTYVSGNLGIGTTTPTTKLDITGTVKAAATSNTGATMVVTNSGNGIGSHAIYASIDNPAGNSGAAAVYATNTGSGYSYYGSSGGTGAYITGSGNTGKGVHARATGNYGIGLYAEATGAEATALTAGATGARGIAVYATNASTDPSVRIRNAGTGYLIEGRNSVNSTVFRVANDGLTTVKLLEITGGADLAEPFEVAGANEAKPGMVMCIDANNAGKLMISKRAFDRTVAGVISGAGGIAPGMVMGKKGSMADGDHPVALTGRVWTWCDSTSGAIRPGDLLTTSDIMGHAMKVAEYEKAQGAIIGKAMTSLDSGKGLVLVLVSLQ